MAKVVSLFFIILNANTFRFHFLWEKSV
jgi:hypothetical protein